MKEVILVAKETDRLVSDDYHVLRCTPKGILLVYDPATCVADGTTDQDGNVGGTTVRDTTRTELNDHWNNMALLITSGAQQGQVREITDWVLATGTFTVAPAFGGQILTGVTYKILAILPVHVDIAAIEAKLDDGTHGLAALKDEIDANETKIDAVEEKLDADLLIDRGRIKSVEVGDIANWHIELIQNRGGIIPAADIDEGSCVIEHWRVAAKIADIAPTSHVAADGEIHTVYTFSAAEGWQPGDQAHIIISGASVVIGGITTSLPDIEFHVRMSREKTISDKVDAVEGKLDVPANFMADVSGLLAVLLGTPDVVELTTALDTWQTAVNVTGQGMLCSVYLYDEWADIAVAGSMRVTIDGTLIESWDTITEVSKHFMSALWSGTEPQHHNAFWHFMFPYRTSLLVEWRCRPADRDVTISVHYTNTP